jgi:hypothetical protein
MTAAKGPLNYSTTVGVDRTVTEITKRLAAAGASRVTTEYDPGSTVPTGLTFTLPTPHGDRLFTLPVNVAGMRAVLVAADRAGRLRTGSKTGRASVEQAQRVAWRVVKDWLFSQLALIDAQQATLVQVMLPYMRVDGDRTLFDAYADQEDAARAALDR